MNNLAAKVALDVSTLFNSASNMAANTSGSGISTVLNTPTTNTWAMAKALLVAGLHPGGRACSPSSIRSSMGAAADDAGLVQSDRAHCGNVR